MNQINLSINEINLGVLHASLLAQNVCFVVSRNTSAEYLPHFRPRFISFTGYCPYLESTCVACSVYKFFFALDRVYSNLQ